MATQDFKRKLTAILSADVKGYSRLMREDEDATVQTITTYREGFATIVDKHGGRVVDSTGDNILAEFASVVNAVRSAAEIQEELRIRNAKLPEDRRMEFRIGINLGDVIHEEERIYGDGINVAARLESLADPGGICISRSAYDQVKKKLTLGYEYLGEHTVKNIDEPVRVYRVLMEPDAAGKVIGEKQPGPTRGHRATLAAVIALLLLSGVVTILRSYLRTSSPALEKMALPLPSKPAIAVLPLTNMSGDPDQEYFSDGITDDLITDLSKISGLFVIASNSTFAYKGKPIDIRQVAEELGVRYVLEGSVRKADEEVRINAQLIDATTGYHLWAERYDGKLSDIFALHDRVTREIVAALAVRLTADEQLQVSRKATDNFEAYDAYLQGLEHKRRNTRKDTVRAVSYLKQAVELDPNFSQAHALLAGCYARSMFRGWDRYLGWSNTHSLAQKHVQLALRSPTPAAHRVAASLRMQELQYEEAINEAERAIALDPNDAKSQFWMGRVLIYSGRSAEAIQYLKGATRLNPYSPGGYLWNLGLAHFCLEQFEEAVTLLERAQERNPEIAPWLLAGTYAHLGRKKEASDVLAEYIKRRGFKRITVQKVLAKYPWISHLKLSSDRNRFAEGLRKAGMPLK